YLNTEMIDSHCHLSDNSFKEDVDKVIEKAIEFGVIQMIVVCEYADQAVKVIELSERWKGNIIPSIGVHPIQKRNKSVQIKHFDLIEPLIRKYSGKIGCIGEIGLDFSPRYKLTEEQKSVQIEVFKRQLDMARELNLAVNIHSRCASTETLSILSSYCLPILLHAFDGKEDAIKQAIQMGCYLSIPPAFTLSDQGKLLISLCPLSQLLLESDSPALGVEKGRNEPSSLSLSANFISRIKGIPLQDVYDISTHNAKTLFRL
ncbi:hypothetical protein PRIPAC_91077, partial [Pristionchus pacificus]|uniref:Uncharacterized protein n=1 Tax=Pristionchus pacificus TaxID=54126 RepID=A0A8R1V4V9_PRIPA